MLRIVEYTISDLERCLWPGRWFQCDPVPITKQRALSHVRNPRAEKTDVALLVAYDEDVVVGHLGVLPDKAFVNLGEQKIGWVTAWWADPDRKYVGLGLMLLMRALNLYGGRLGASGFSDDARKVYDATKRFAMIKDAQGVSGIARLNLCRLLRRRLPSLAKLRTVLGAVDAIVNVCVSIRQFWWRKSHRLPGSCQIEYFAELDQEADEFIQRHSAAGLTRRGARELNWIINYPWVLCAPLARRSSFHFSAQAESYSVYCIKIYTPGGLAAVLLLTMMDGHVTVPYCYHGGQSKLIARVLCHFLIVQRAERLTIYEPELIEELSALRFPWLGMIHKRRTWIWSRECAGQGSNKFSMQDGDGDCAFAT